jgi:hypothetical protein
MTDDGSTALLEANLGNSARVVFVNTAWKVKSGLLDRRALLKVAKN